MLTELKQLIENRPLTITVASLSDGRMRVNVVPQALAKDAEANDKIKYSHKNEVAEVPDSALKALTTPLSLTGTAEELDAELPRALLEYSEIHRRLQQTLEDAKSQIIEAVKAIDEREKAKAKSKSSANSKSDEKDAKAKQSKPDEGGLLPLWCAPSGDKVSPQTTQSALQSTGPSENTPSQSTAQEVIPCP